MPRKGEYRRRNRPVDKPASLSRIGIREVSGWQHAKGFRTIRLDPARFTCSVLAGELADEWVELSAAAELTMGTVHCYRHAIVEFCAFVDQSLPASATATLEHAEPDLLPVILEWVRILPSRYPAGSQEPAGLASRVRNLIRHRTQHPDRPVTTLLDGWLTGAIGLRKGVTQQVDEFTRADKRALIRAAWDELRTLEQRLRHGAELLAAGADPRSASDAWLVPANLLWALNHGIETREILAHLPPPDQWPSALAELTPPTLTSATMRRRALLRVLVGMLYPHNLDLHAFRVLLMAATGHTSEEVTGLAEADVEFTAHGVELTFTKLRAHAVRRRAYGAAPVPATTAVSHVSKPRLDAADIVRRLMAVTERLRRRSSLAPTPLFVRAVVHIYDLTIRPFDGDMNGAGFKTWLDRVGVTLEGPADIRRLRKSGKVEKALAYRGRVNDIADDHSVEVFRGHYAHGTTLHVIAGQVITAAQQRWLAEAVTGPTVLTSDGEAHLDHAQAPATMGLSTEQIERLRSGAMDMGVSSCRDPLDSPFGRPGQPCPVAPLRCLECRHAVVLPSNLPQLLLLADHLETLRRRVTPQHFHALWGQSHANLTAVLGDRTDAEIALARKQIDTGEATLHLPLSARVEFDR